MFNHCLNFPESNTFYAPPLSLIWKISIFKDFLIDLHRAIEKIWFGPQELPATKFAECIMLPAGRERMSYETELKDFLKEGESAIYR